jgi:hypothetical protein
MLADSTQSQPEGTAQQTTHTHPYSAFPTSLNFTLSPPLGLAVMPP